MELLYKELLPYDHIIFDWNGTLLSDVELVAGILNDSLAKHELPPITIEKFRDQFCFPIRDFYKTLGMKDEHYDSFQSQYHQFYNERYRTSKLYAGTEDLINELKGLGKTLSILSASEQTHLHEAVDHFGIMHHMSHVYGLSDRSAEGKAARGHELLSQISGTREKTVIVGDTLYDAEVGKSLNIDVLLVADGHQSYKQLSQAPFKILPSRYRS